ncbi:hypothetical protein OH77DRAFT_1428467 [Trametes cingulata]|nr:hypothetical protein OH77DRAFT_1428467 [Trametes cingulata]
MPPTRSSSSKRAASRESSVEKALPSLNELFPGTCVSYFIRITSLTGYAETEDLFRGSFAQPNQPSTSVLPLSMTRTDSHNHHAAVRSTHELSPELPPALMPIPSQPRPRSPTDAHPASRGGRRSPATIADRSHQHPPPLPQSSSGPTEPPQPVDGSGSSGSSSQRQSRTWSIPSPRAQYATRARRPGIVSTHFVSPPHGVRIPPCRSLGGAIPSRLDSQLAAVFELEPHAERDRAVHPEPRRRARLRAHAHAGPAPIRPPAH